MAIFLFLDPQLDNHEIKPGKTLKINVSVPNLRLFVGNIPKSKGKEEILDEFGKLTGKVAKIQKQTRNQASVDRVAAGCQAQSYRACSLTNPAPCPRPLPANT